MRVRRFSLIRLRDEEQGATLAIVAICLISLLGMLVLTFDLGRGVALKRNMVNGADAAALAAARECGLANGDVAAKQAATQLLADNNGAATILPGTAGFRINPTSAQCSGAPNPDPDHNPTVTVTVSVPQQYFFAPIFGINNGTVVATATAEWTMGETNPAPLKIDQLKVDQCIKQGDTPPLDGRVDCYFTFEKGPQPLNSDWGWLNLPEGWPIEANKDPNPMPCTSQKGGSKDLSDYISSMGGTGEQGKELLALLWDPSGGGEPPTYVCGSTGHKSSSVQAIQDWVDNVKKLMADGKPEPVVMFPIVACDPTKPVDPTTDPSTCRKWEYTPGVAFPVVNLEAFYVKGAWDRSKIPPAEKANCKFVRPSSDSFCIHLQASLAGQNPTGGSVTVRLVG